MRYLRNQPCLLTAILLLTCASACVEKTKPKPANTAVSDAKPKIAVTEKLYNFGKVKQGQSVEHVFEIQNQGNADLVVEEARGSCGCLATVVSANRIAPGGKGQVKATLSTAGRQGKLSKRIFVTSNDTVDRRLVLSIEGEVAADVVVTPQYLWLKEVKKGDKTSLEFSVTVNEPERVKVSSVTVEDKRFIIRRKSGDPKASAVYELQFLGSLKPESIATQVSVNAEGASNPTLRVPARLEIVGDLRYPKIVQFFKKDGQTNPVDVSFVSRSNKAFKIKRTEDPNNVLKLEIVESNGPNAKIRAQLADEKASLKPATRYTFTVYTDDRSEPKVEIGYMVYQVPPSRAPRLRPPIAPPPIPPAPAPAPK